MRGISAFTNTFEIYFKFWKGGSFLIMQDYQFEKQLRPAELGLGS